MIKIVHLTDSWVAPLKLFLILWYFFCYTNTNAVFDRPQRTCVTFFSNSNIKDDSLEIMCEGLLSYYSVSSSFSFLLFYFKHSYMLNIKCIETCTCPNFSTFFLVVYFHKINLLNAVVRRRDNPHAFFYCKWTDVRSCVDDDYEHKKYSMHWLTRQMSQVQFFFE